MRKTSLSLFCTFAVLLFLIPAASHAESIDGTSIYVTSVFDGEPAQYANFADITATRVNAGVFSDWMVGADSGTNLTFIPGTDNGDQRTRNVFDLNFSGDQLYNNFSSSDTLSLTFQLDPGLVFNTNYMAITIAKDTQVPSSSVNDGTLTLNIDGLDQLAGNGGQLQLIFDVEPQGFDAVPEPSTLLLGLPVFAMIFFAFRRRGVAQGL
ncbi:MAG TPA: PEP-CTERM sorting domain-containing protein [Bryobacteraceae bacterium]|nr:PEP-CTERM sorting domain-containing protein [Bryobacteraceae bacterium]